MQRRRLMRGMFATTSAVIAGAFIAGTAFAQELPPSEYDGLKKRLEQRRFQPSQKTRSLAPQAEPTQKSVDDYLFIEQKKQDDRDKEAIPGVRGNVTKSSSTWYGSIFSYVSEKLGIAKQPPEPASENTIDATQENPQEARSSFPKTRRAINKARDAIRRITRKVPVAKPNSYVVQLKPEATDEEIEALLTNYNLRITKTIPELGVLTVEVNEDKSRTVDSPLGERKQSARDRLQKILEPPLIKDLRKEAIVEGAFVNNTMGARTLPKPQGASIKVGQETVSWRWAPGPSVDGNWGLKTIRMPAVWSILGQLRQRDSGGKTPKIGVIDGGFRKNPAVPFEAITGAQPGSFHKASCGTHHGMHVAGIIGGRQTDEPGIDGIVPNARMDAIGVGSEIVGDAGVLGLEEGWQIHTLLFDEVLGVTLNYVIDSILAQDSPLIVNISLGYNFIAADLLEGASPDDVPGLRAHINHQASLIRKMANRFRDHVLIVVAAGNDSHGLETPIDAKWASPFAWAGTQSSAAGETPTNILVVEAVDREGRRASFSNTGGHISAPGVDIMSTLGDGNDAFGLCSGTSQAAPHVTGVAALLFELDSSRTPTEVGDAIKSSARAAATTGTAPIIDALESAIKNSIVAVSQAADLDNSGTVDDGDLRIFARHIEQIAKAATENAAFTEDLNGDGVINDNECFWPRVDLNGSGFGALNPKDKQSILGQPQTDRNIMALAWRDASRPFDVAMNAAGLGSANPIAVSFGKLDLPTTQCRGVIKVADASTTLTDGRPTNPTPGVTPSAGKQSDPDAVKKKVLDAAGELQRSNPKLKVIVDPKTGMPSKIIGIAPQTSASAIGANTGDGTLTEEETKAAVEAFFGLPGIRSLHPTDNVSSSQKYVGRRRDPDFPDRYVAEVEQRVGGVPVFGSSAKLTVQRSLGVTSYRGKTSAATIDDVTPGVTKDQAVSKARAKLKELLRTAPGGARAFPLTADPDKVEVKDPELTVFDPALVRRAKGVTRLSWVVPIDSFKIFIDAKTGEAFHYYRDQPSGMIRRIYDLGGRPVFPGTLGIDEKTATRASNLSDEAMAAFLNAGYVRDFFFLNFGRGSFDDTDGVGGTSGSALEAYVGFGQTQNAYWCMNKSYDCPKSNVMVYGPGYAGAIDIVAHEMTHGIIAYESKLKYFDEPGAVNEALSDIFGVLIELHIDGAGGNWLIGEKSPGFSITNPLRSLSAPNLEDDSGRSMFRRNERFSLSNRGQPDHYSEVLTPDDELCGSTAWNDNGCVHFNSGILNKLAYLAAEGGTHHGVTVQPIGPVKLARVSYRVMTIGLNPTSGLSDAANAFVQACEELADGRIADISAFDCTQLSAAREAVGLQPPST